MGRERPRLRLAKAAPRPFSGVAHAHVSASEMCLGRASRAPEARDGLTRYLASDLNRKMSTDCALPSLEFSGRDAQLYRLDFPASR